MILLVFDTIAIKLETLMIDPWSAIQY